MSISLLHFLLSVRLMFTLTFVLPAQYVTASNWSPPGTGQAQYWCGTNAYTSTTGQGSTCTTNTQFIMYHLAYFPPRSKIMGSSGDNRIFSVDMANSQIVGTDFSWSSGSNPKKLIFDPYMFRKVYFMTDGALIRTIDLTGAGNNPVTEIGGGSSAPVCTGTSCSIGYADNGGGFRIMNRRIYIPDTTNGRIIRGTLSEKIMSTLVNINYPFYIAYYKGSLWVTKENTHYCISKVNYLTGSLIEPALGSLTAATALTHTNTRDIEVDCARKVMYIPQVKLNFITRYSFVTRVHEAIIGTGAISYNGPGPMAGLSYLTEEPTSTTVYQNTLIFVHGGDRRLHLYGLPTSASDSASCITQSRSQSQTDSIKKVEKAWRFYGDSSVTTVLGEGLNARNNPTKVSAVSIAHMVVNPINRDLLSLGDSSTSCRVQKVAYYQGIVNTLIGPTATEQCSTVDHASSPTTARVQPGKGMVFAVISTSTKYLFFAQLAATYCGIRYMDLVTSAVGAYAIQSTCTDGASNVARTSASFVQVQGMDVRRGVMYFGNVGQTLIGRISLVTEVYTTATVSGSCPSNCQSVQVFRNRMYFTASSRHTIDYVDLAYPETVVTWQGVVGSAGYSLSSPLQFNNIFNLHFACQRRSLFVTESIGHVAKEILLSGSAFRRVGTYSASTCTGPITSSSSSYNVPGAGGVVTMGDELYVGARTCNEITAVGMTWGVQDTCTTYTKSRRSGTVMRRKMTASLSGSGKERYSTTRTMNTDEPIAKVTKTRSRTKTKTLKVVTLPPTTTSSSNNSSNASTVPSSPPPTPSASTNSTFPPSSTPLTSTITPTPTPVVPSTPVLSPVPSSTSNSTNTTLDPSTPTESGGPVLTPAITTASPGAPATTPPPRKRTQTLSLRRPITRTRTIQITTEEFIVGFEDDADTLTETRINEMIDGFIKLSPGTLRNNVKVVKVDRGSSLVHFLVTNTSGLDWPTTKQSIVTGNLMPVGATSTVVPAEAASIVSDAVTGFPITVCTATAVLNGNAPQVGNGLWSIMNSTGNISATRILRTSDPLSDVTGVPLGTTWFKWTITQLAVSTTANVTVYRVSPPPLSAGLDRRVTTATTTMLATTTVNTTGGMWTVLSGTVDVMNTSDPLSAVRGIGRAKLMWTVNDSFCGELSATVQIDFPLPTATCDANQTCNAHGVCRVDGTCTCYDSPLIGSFAGLNCERCAAGYNGTNCTTRVCVNNSASCVHGTCNDNSECVCEQSTSGGMWSGTACSVCVANPTLGYYAGATCSDCASGFSGATCTTMCMDSVDCSGHGTCSRTGCKCFSSNDLGYWAGPKCDTCQYPYTGASCTGVCTNRKTCSGHGECVATKDVCQCFQSETKGYYATTTNLSSTTPPTAYCTVCDASHTGATCTENIRKATCRTWCINGACDNNGNCLCYGNATFGSWSGVACDTCSASADRGYWSGSKCNECVAGYYGDLCDKPCPFNKCSGRGQCAKTFGLCVCNNSVATGMWDGSTGCATCMNNYFGTGCTVYCTAATCSGHGACNTEGKCTCNSSPAAGVGYWTGETCSMCSGLRSYESGCTVCKADVYGSDCSVLCVASTTCNGHGNCSSSGTCVCNNSTQLGHWGGTSCSSCLPGYEGVGCVGVTKIGATCGATLRLSVSSVRFTVAFHAVVFTFSSLTDQGLRGVGSVTSKCTDLFDIPSLQLLGTDDAVCEWLSPQEVQVSLGVNSRVSVGSMLSPKDGVLFALDDAYSSKCSVGGSFAPQPVLAPSSTMTPRAILTGPPSMNYCSDLDLSASSSTLSSPRMSYKYEASINNTMDIKRLQNYLRLVPYTASELHIPNSMLPDNGLLTFRLTLRDEFTGLSSQTSQQVLKRGRNDPAPDLVIKGVKERTFLRSEKVFGLTHASFNPCLPVPSAGGITFTWTILPAIGVNPPQTPTWTIPSFALSGSTTYAISVKATDPYNNSATDSIRVSVVYGDLTARVLSVSMVSTNVTLQCDCVDQDAEPVTESITWTCENCSAALRTSLSGVTGRVITLTNVAAPQSFVPIVMYRKGTRNVTSTWTVEPLNVRSASSNTADRVLDLYITGPSKVIRSKRAVFQTSLQGVQYRYTWSCVAPCSLNFTDASVTLLGNTNEQLLILPNKAPRGGELTIGVTVVDVMTGASGQASFTSKVSRPPEGGRVVLGSYTPTALTTLSLTTTDWIADDGASPLSYQWSVMTESGETFMLTEFTSSSSTSAQLLQVALPEESVVLSVVVRDHNGDSDRRDTAVVIQRASGDVASTVVSAAEGTITLLYREGSSNRIVQTLQVVTTATTNVSGSLFDSSMSVLSSIAITSDSIGQVSTVMSGMSSGSSSEAIQANTGHMHAVLDGLLGDEDAQYDTTTRTNVLSTLGNLASAYTVPPASKSNNSTTNSHQHHRSYSSRSATDDGNNNGGMMMSAIAKNIALVEKLGGVSMKGSASSERTATSTGSMSMGCVKKATGVMQSDTSAQSTMTVGMEGDGGMNTVCQTNWGTDIFSQVATRTAGQSTTKSSKTQQRNITSSVVSIAILTDSGTRQSMTEGSGNVSFVINLEKPLRPDRRPVCTYFDFTQQQYSTRGCQVAGIVRDGRAVLCKCTHLTDFATGEEDIAAQIKPKVYIDVGNFADIKIGGIIYVAVLSGIFVLLTVMFFAYDQYQQKVINRTYYTRLYECVKARRKSIGVIYGRSDFLLDAEGCNMIPLTCTVPEQPPGSALRMSNILYRSLEFHPWLSPFTADPNSSFTMPQRGWLLACLAVCAMMWNGIFFASDTAPEQQKTVNYVYALICVTLSAPLLTIIITYAYTRTRRTEYDVRNWYVPKSVRGIDLEGQSVSVEEYVQKCTYNEPSPCEKVELNLFELEQVEDALRSNGVYLCALSVAIVRRQQCLQQEDALDDSWEGYGNQQAMKEDTDPNDPYTVTTVEVPPMIDYEEWVQMHDMRPISPLEEVDVVNPPPPKQNERRYSTIPVNFIDLVTQKHMNVYDGTAHTNPLISMEPIEDIHDETENLVIQTLCEWLRTPYKTNDPYFMASTQKVPELENMWRWESQRCTWRLAVLAVEEEEFQLAECLFEVALLMEVPELYFILHSSSTDDADLEKTLEAIVSACKARTNVVGRAWSEYYAIARLGIPPSKYKTMSAASETPSGLCLQVLLGLDNKASYLAFGCVDYSVAMEASKHGTYSFPDVLDMIAGSKVMPSHLLRQFVVASEAERRPEDALMEATRCVTRSTTTTTTTTTTDTRLDGFIAHAQERAAEYEASVHGRRYGPHSTDSTLTGVSSMLPAFVLNKLLESELSHNNIHGTIEFGRLATMLMDKRLHKTSFAGFAKAYQNELFHIRSFDKALSIDFSATFGWQPVREGVYFDPKTTSQGNNHFPPYVDAPNGITPSYLVYLLNFRATGQMSTRYTCSTSNATKLCGLAQYLPPRLRGSGSVVSPHMSWGAVESGLRVGDILYLYPGTYAPGNMKNLQTPNKSPVCVMPVGWTPKPSTEKKGDVMCERVVSLETPEDDVAGGTSLKLTNCNNMKFEGISIVCMQGVGIVADNCEGLEFRHCRVEAQVPGVFDGGRDLVSRERTNTVVSGSATVSSRLRTLTLPALFVVLMHAVVVGIYVMLCMMCLFVTAAMTQEESDEWIRRSAISIVMKVFAISPAMSLVKVFVRVYQSSTEVDLGSGVDFDIGDS